MAPWSQQPQGAEGRTTPWTRPSQTHTCGSRTDRGSRRTWRTQQTLENMTTPYNERGHYWLEQAPPLSLWYKAVSLCLNNYWKTVFWGTRRLSPVLSCCSQLICYDSRTRCCLPMIRRVIVGLNCNNTILLHKTQSMKPLNVSRELSVSSARLNEYIESAGQTFVINTEPHNLSNQYFILHQSNRITLDYYFELLSYSCSPPSQHEIFRGLRFK